MVPGYYLLTITVPIPEDKLIVIRDGKKVEYEVDRTYIGNRSTRVKRKVIGKVDPVQVGRMFPNEAYFELFPDNEVPGEVRDEFLRECEIKRQMKVIRRSPEEIVDNVVRGLGMLNQGAFRSPPGTPSADCSPNPLRPECFMNEMEKQMKYTMLRRVFDEMYYAVEELAGKFPNEVIVPFKVERINEVLEALRGAFLFNKGATGAFAPLPPSVDAPHDTCSDESIYGYLRLVEEGLTYSDVMLIMKWYKVLPR
jgi:hypothetical protein